MKNKLVLSFLLLTSCTDPGPVKDSTITFEVPELGTVTRYSIHSGDGGRHYIYTIKNRNEVNITIPKQGKAGHQKTIVIDGQEFDLVPKLK